MPSLHEELAAEKRGGACKVCSFLTRLPEAMRAEWEVEIARKNARDEYDIPNTVIAVALRRRNLPIEEASVRRHRANHVAT